MIALELLPDFLDPQKLAAAGLLVIGAIVFAESGLLIGFFLPGDSLLFAAGMAAAAGVFPIEALVLVVFVCAVAGDAVGYWFGSKAGPTLFRRPSSRLFKAEHLERARQFYVNHGGKTIIIARFVPFVRTFAPIVAGATGMPYARFAMFNVVGAFIWGVGVPTLGFLLGNAIPDLERYLLPIVGVIIMLSVAPIVVQAIRHRRRARRATV